MKKVAFSCEKLPEYDLKTETKYLKAVESN
jgi:hypothetical protein